MTRPRDLFPLAVAITLLVTVWAWGVVHDVGANAAPHWVLIRHESGVRYVVRTANVIGVLQPIPGDPGGKSGIMLSNGSTIATTLDVDELVALLVSDGPVKEYGE